MCVLAKCWGLDADSSIPLDKTIMEAQTAATKFAYSFVGRAGKRTDTYDIIQQNRNRSPVYMETQVSETYIKTKLIKIDQYNSKNQGNNSPCELKNIFIILLGRVCGSLNNLISWPEISWECAWEYTRYIYAIKPNDLCEF